MTFDASKYANFIAGSTAAQERLFLQYIGPRDDFDIVDVDFELVGVAAVGTDSDRHQDLDDDTTRSAHHVHR